MPTRSVKVATLEGNVGLIRPNCVPVEVANVQQSHAEMLEYETPKIIRGCDSSVVHCQSAVKAQVGLTCWVSLKQSLMPHSPNMSKLERSCQYLPAALVSDIHRAREGSKRGREIEGVREGFLRIPG